MSETDGADGGLCMRNPKELAPHSAGETYRDHVIVVTLVPGEAGWHSLCTVYTALRNDPAVSYRLDGPFPDRPTTYQLTTQSAKRKIDRWLTELGL